MTETTIQARGTRPRHRAAAALIGAAVLAACGGGGGDDGGGGGGGGTTPHTIGGRVDGLTGSGLVLQNNGGNNLAVSAAGAFQFTQTVAHGGTYAVTVHTQPQGQACGVANGSGTANAAVSNIVVTCGAPLALYSSFPAHGASDIARNAAPTLGFTAPLDVATVAANVTLTRAGRVVAATASASGSTVTVTPQAPLMPLASYTLAAATGLRGQAGQTLASAASVGFTTRDGAWQAAQLIETGDGEAINPQVATDASGNALAVWQQHDGTRTNIWANRYTAGTGWGTAALIETDNAGAATDPQIAMDANGNALAVWSQFDGSRVNLLANRYTAGAGWGTPTLIESETGNAREPKIAFDAAGNALAVWHQTQGERANLWANRYTAGTGWGTAALIETNDAGSAAQVQLAVGAGGNAIAVWKQHDGRNDSIWSNRYTAGTGWGTAVLVENANDGADQEPQVAIDANGNALAVWSRHAGTRTDVWANRYTADAGWGTPVLIESDDAGSAIHPQLAFDASGNALALWTRQTDGGAVDSVWSNRYTAGTGWGTPAQVGSSHMAFGSRIAFDVNGHALAVGYEVNEGGHYNAWASRYQAGRGWSAPVPLESDHTGAMSGVELAIDANGSALAVWLQVSGARVNILASRFE